MTPRPYPRRPIRVIVTGWRDASIVEHEERIAEALNLAVLVVHRRDDDMPSHPPTLVHGDCSGVDRIAATCARRLGWTIEAHPAQLHPTQDFGLWPAAGPRRNRYMVTLGADMCVGIPGPSSRGTWDCLRVAAGAGIDLLVFPITTNHIQREERIGVHRS
jgi:hypothetical protein